MASIYRRPGSGFWMARFKGPDGKWKSRSTKTTAAADARRLSFLWEGAGATMAIDSQTGAQIDRVVRQLYEQYSGKRLQPNPARVFMTAWIDRMKATKAPKTALRYRRPVEDFLEFLGERADTDIRAIQTSDVQTFIDAQAAGGKGTTTVSLNAKIIRAVFNTAMRAGAIEKNPAGMLEVADIVHEERDPFTPSEVNALLAFAAKTDWETAILLGALAGLRIGDAANLKWESVDFGATLIKFTPQKTSRKKRTLTVPMHPRLIAHLEKLASTDAAQKSPFLCPALAGRDVSGRAGLSAEFIDKVMAPAGMDPDRTEKPKGVGHRVARKSFHSLRHAFVSGMANAGVAADVRRKLAGHSDEKQTARYSHLEMKTLRKAVGKLPGGVK
jgi:integrase